MQTNLFYDVFIENHFKWLVDGSYWCRWVLGAVYSLYKAHMTQLLQYNTSGGNIEQ